jgi:predicted nucleic acid-binding Zn ribbon protein
MLGTAQPPFPAECNDKNGSDKEKKRKGISMDGFLLFALVAVYFVISYEQ